MQDFAAIDFETANNERSSVCSVGVVIVRGGEIVDKFYITTTTPCLMRRRMWLCVGNIVISYVIYTNDD